MKNKNIKLLLILLILISTLFAVGCSSKVYESSMDNSVGQSSMGKGDYNDGIVGMPAPPSYDMDQPETQAPEMPQVDNGNKGKVNPLEPKKVITTVNLQFETAEFDKTDKDLNGILVKYNAYIENSSISSNNYSSYGSGNFRYANYVVRVPSTKVNEFKLEVVGIGNKINESTSKDDVTSQYADTESRLKVITIKEERILSLLERAERIEDIIALENQLSQTIQEKENLKSSLIILDDKVDFSTFYISIQETSKLTTQETIETTFGMKMKEAFKDSIYNFKRSFEKSIIELIGISPLLLIIVTIIVIVISINKKRKKRYGNIK